MWTVAPFHFQITNGIETGSGGKAIINMITYDAVVNGQFVKDARTTTRLVFNDAGRIITQETLYDPILVIASGSAMHLDSESTRQTANLALLVGMAAFLVGVATVSYTMGHKKRGEVSLLG